MEYTFPQYGRLVREIDRQGGRHLEDKVCEAKQYSFSGPNPDYKSVFLPGCGNNSIFEVPYLPEGGDGDTVTIENMELCAVCDDLGHMPRFQDVIGGPY